MKRYAINQLIEWKNSATRKPLIIEGARQVGKTWLVKDFAKSHYKNIAYVNFEEQIFMRTLFESDFDVNRIISMINAAAHVVCEPGKTLIFLDEIQEAHNGLTALKYFQENAPEQHIVVAGSLLGNELHKKISFPVGKVEFMTLQPMCFMEFLDALGEENLSALVQRQDWDGISIFSTKLKELLRSYYYVGGMPEAVATFCNTKDWKKVRTVQQEIINGHRRDFSKHAPNDVVPRISQIWDSIPAQLSKENRRFIYGVVKSGARAREYEVALQWLFDAGLIHSVSNVTAPRIPLKSYEDKNAFKIYMVDIGLLCAMCELDSETIVKGNDIFTEFKGALTEQYVLQQLKLKYNPYYWSKQNSQQEIDFLIQKEGKIYPIEVKAEENLKAKSLRMYAEAYNPPKAIRTSMANYRDDGWMLNIPLYAIREL
jgi:predicted AAA+ superfamily ATPase